MFRLWCRHWARSSQDVSLLGAAVSPATEPCPCSHCNSTAINLSWPHCSESDTSLCAVLTLPLQPKCQFQPWICAFWALMCRALKSMERFLFASTFLCLAHSSSVEVLTSPKAPKHQEWGGKGLLRHSFKFALAKQPYKSLNLSKKYWLLRENSDAVVVWGKVLVSAPK